MNVTTLHQFLPDLLADGYRLFSRSQEKIPDNHSPFAHTKGVEFADSPIERIVRHGDRSVSLKVHYGWLRFWC